MGGREDDHGMLRQQAAFTFGFSKQFFDIPDDQAEGTANVQFSLNSQSSASQDAANCPVGCRSLWLPTPSMELIIH